MQIKDKTSVSTGNIRQMLIDTMTGLHSKDISLQEAAVTALLSDAITKSMQVEINSAKLSIQTEGKLYAFGKVTKMGRLIINDAGLE